MDVLRCLPRAYNARIKCQLRKRRKGSTATGHFSLAPLLVCSWGTGTTTWHGLGLSEQCILGVLEVPWYVPSHHHTRPPIHTHLPHGHIFSRCAAASCFLLLGRRRDPIYSGLHSEEFRLSCSTVPPSYQSSSPLQYHSRTYSDQTLNQGVPVPER